MDQGRDPHPGVTDADLQAREELAAYIGDAPYPTDRRQLVETAQDNGAPDHWLTVLEHLPPDYRFDDSAEVAAALGFGYRARPS